MNKIWCACVGIDRFSITEADRGSIRESNGWSYGGDGEHYQAFEAKKDAESAVIKLMQKRFEFATEAMESLGSPTGARKWTSIADMPKEAGLYLTLWSDGVTESFPLTENRLGELEFETVCNSNVTHWMPLPDAPN